MFPISSNQKDKLIETIIDFINKDVALDNVKTNKLTKHLNNTIKDNMPASVGFFRGLPDDFIELAMRRSKVEYTGTDTLSCVFTGDNNILVYELGQWKEI